MKNFSKLPQMKRMCAIVLLLMMGFTFSESSSQCVMPPSGLVSWWRAENDATDFIGDNHGTLINGLTFAPGKVGQAFSFDGVDDYIRIPVSPDFDFSGSFSVGYWFKTVGSETQYQMLSYNPTTDRGFVVYGTAKLADFYAPYPSNWARTSTSDFNDNQWHYLMVLRDGTTLRHYIDAVLLDVKTLAGDITSNTDLLIGTNNDFLGFYVGLIDDVEFYNRALSASEIQSIYNAGSAGKCTDIPPPVCVTPPSGLISWWRGENDANDFTSGNHGTLINGATFSPGKAGQAFSFDGVDDYVTIASSANLTLTSAVSVELWFNASSQAANQVLASRVDGVGQGWQVDYTANGGMNFWIGTGGIWARASTSSPSSNTWHHVAGTWDGSIIRLYVDGVEVNSTAKTGAISASATEITIGTYNADLTAGYFKGLIDEVDIYNRSLSVSEIQSIYNAGSAGKCTNTPPPVCVNPPSGLISWWPGDGNANDIQGSNHGALTNGATFAPGKVGQAFSVDGIDDFVRIEDISNLRLSTDEITIDAWIKAPSGNTFRAIAAKLGISFPFPGYALVIADDNKVEFFAVDCATVSCGFSLPGGGGSRQPVRSISVVADNTFHHVAGVRRSDGTLEIYVDGVLENTRFEPLRNTDSADPFTIGDIHAGGSEQPFNGLIDEVDIYNRALSAAEIQSIYNAGSAGKCKECTPPEVSITGNDPVFTGTTHTYTATTDATNPSFEWSVTGGTINGSNSNNSVSITAGAVGTMMVSVNVTDGVTNCSKEETKSVTVNPLPAGSNEVVFATNSVWLKEHANVLSGNVVVNNASSGPTLDSQVELSVGQSVTTPAGFALKANRIKVKQGAVVASDVFYNELTNNGAISGSQNTPLALPVFASLPPFHQAPAGTQDITVNQNESITLTAGAYRDIFIKQNGTILFTGGSFALRSLNTGTKAKLLFDAPTEILIEGKLDTDENSYVGPQSGSGIGAADIVFYIAGSNGNNGNFGATPKAAQLGLKNTVLANFYAPNGTLWLRQGTVATGAFLGRDVIVGEQVQVALESAFDGGSSFAKSANNEGDEEKLISTAIPEAFVLLQNYPNPFNPGTVISFALPEAGEVKLHIYSTTGQLVRSLVDNEMPAGQHAVSWNGLNESGNTVAAGVYLYRLVVQRQNGETAFTETRRMTLVK